MLKIAVSKPPANGAANAAVLELLARAAGIPRGSVRIVRGGTSPRKEIAVAGVNIESLRSKLAAGI